MGDQQPPGTDVATPSQYARCGLCYHPAYVVPDDDAHGAFSPFSERCSALSHRATPEAYQRCIRCRRTAFVPTALARWEETLPLQPVLESLVEPRINVTQSLAVELDSNAHAALNRVWARLRDGGVELLEVGRLLSLAARAIVYVKGDRYELDTTTERADTDSEFVIKLVQKLDGLADRLEAAPA
jgi:hypothetical protein